MLIHLSSYWWWIRRRHAVSLWNKRSKMWAKVIFPSLRYLTLKIDPKWKIKYCLIVIRICGWSTLSSIWTKLMILNGFKLYYNLFRKLKHNSTLVNLEVRCSTWISKPMRKKVTWRRLRKIKLKAKFWRELSLKAACMPKVHQLSAAVNLIVLTAAVRTLMNIHIANHCMITIHLKISSLVNGRRRWMNLNMR